MRKIVSLMLVALMLITSTAWAESDTLSGKKKDYYKIYVNHSLKNYRMILQEGRLLVPARLFTESLKAKGVWNPKTKTYTITRGSNTIIYSLGKGKAKVNGKEKDLPAKAKISTVKGSMYIPVAFTLDYLGDKYKYHHPKVIYITSDYIQESLTKRIKLPTQTVKYDTYGALYEMEFNGLTVAEYFLHGRWHGGSDGKVAELTGTTKKLNDKYPNSPAPYDNARITVNYSDGTSNVKEFSGITVQKSDDNYTFYFGFGLKKNKQIDTIVLEQMTGYENEKPVYTEPIIFDINRSF